jgi:excinuclease ABC subunit C
MEILKANKTSLAQTPETPGVYQFTDKNRKPIYIGKAKNLKSRLGSYFSEGLGAKTAHMVATAEYIQIIKVNSEVEALLLEANLVRKFMPLYNSELKDDKSPLYIGITKEKYPRVIALRKTQLDTIVLKNVYGPFTQGSSVRKVLKILRRVIPYTTHKPGKSACIYHQIGQCDPCPSEIEATSDLRQKKEMLQQFKKNIANVRKFLVGDFKSLQKNLETQMKKFSNEERFEEAAKVAHQLEMVNHVTSTQIMPNDYITNPDLIEEIRDKELEDVKNLLKPYIRLNSLERIECFDIAHLAGSFPTASMVTLAHGTPDKRFYRHFTIRNNKKSSDVDNMKEVLTRRLKHLDSWGRPDLIIVDGGKPQVSVAIEVIGDKIPVIGLAKRYETLIIKQNKKFIEVKVPRGPALNLVQRIRDEAHRFARRLHHKHISRSMGVW